MPIRQSSPVTASVTAVPVTVRFSPSTPGLSRRLSPPVDVLARVGVDDLVGAAVHVAVGLVAADQVHLSWSGRGHRRAARSALLVAEQSTGVTYLVWRGQRSQVDLRDSAVRFYRLSNVVHARSAGFVADRAGAGSPAGLGAVQPRTGPPAGRATHRRLSTRVPTVTVWPPSPGHITGRGLTVHRGLRTRVNLRRSRKGSPLTGRSARPASAHGQRQKSIFPALLHQVVGEVMVNTEQVGQPPQRPSNLGHEPLKYSSSGALLTKLTPQHRHHPDLVARRACAVGRGSSAQIFSGAPGTMVRRARRVRTGPIHPASAIRTRRKYYRTDQPITQHPILGLRQPQRCRSPKARYSR